MKKRYYNSLNIKKTFTGICGNILTIFGLIFLISQSAFAQKTVPSPGVGGTQAGFEIDSDFRSGVIPNWWNATNYTPPGLTLGDDWSKSGAGNAVLKQLNGISVPGVTADLRSIWQVDGNYGNASAIAELSTFSGSSNKNGDAIGSGQSPYSVQFGGSGPQKNDITNTFLHARELPHAADIHSANVHNHTWLFFGAETRSVDGTSYLDFEYNQAGASVVNSQLVGKGPLNGRTVNDFLLIVNYTGGGNKPIVGIRKILQATGTWSDELTVDNLGAFVTTNTGDIPAVAPNKAFAGNGAASGTTVALQLVEGGVDVTALNLGLNLCTPVATITVKTRSSASYTSELKDFDILNFSLTPPATATVAAVNSQCKAASGSTVFQVSGTYSGGTPLWSISAGGILSNESYVGGVATATVSIAGNGPETVTLTTTSSNSSCPNATAFRTLTILPLPVVTADNKDVCQGGSVTLTGSPAGGTWSGDHVTGSTFSAVGLATGPYTVTYSYTDPTNCNNTNTATITVRVLPNPLADNKEVCAGGSVALTGTPAGGTWSGGHVTGSSFSAVGLAPGQYTVTYEASNAFCTNSTTATVTVNPNPVLVITNPPAVCAPNTVSLTLAAVTAGSTLPANTILTYFQADGVTTLLSPGTVGAGTFYIKATAPGGCTDIEQVVVSVKAKPARPVVSITEATLCGTLTAPKLEVLCPEPGTYTLTQTGIQGNKTFVYNGTNGPVVFENLVAGKQFSITLTIDGCVSDPTNCDNKTNLCPLPEDDRVANPKPQGSAINKEIKAYPVPFYDSVTIQFTSDRDEDYVVNLYDVQGRLVKELKSGYSKAGEVTQIEVDGTRLIGNFYVARKISKSGVSIVKLLKSDR
jgi:hypothetical protein